MIGPGSRIGAYDLVSLLGTGGMGEVYRARDTRLQRDVAIKLLPASVAADPDRLARFTREAQLLAALNHPHIGGIYGLEESGGTTALVLELVEGQTLADRIAQGPLPLEDAIAIARQIADAVEVAHEQGIVHRDLKPANIKLRPDGTVKVLDFGLAKALSSPGTASAAQVDAMQSPTLTDQATAVGMILGTAAYMAPEQARGRAVDRRADVWAFGLILFEMLAGRRPFTGETISETMASIMRDQPSWEDLPATVPEALRALLRRTLEKDPRRRLRDVGDARIELEELEARIARGEPAGASVTANPAATPEPRWRRLLPWAIAALSLVVAAIGATQVRARRTPTDLPHLKYGVTLPGLSLERVTLPSLSPDGRFIAFAKDGGLWVRALDRLEPQQLAGTAGAQYPFWSPDSRQVAYLTGSALWRVAVDGGAPVRIASYKFSKGGRTPGGVWCDDGTVLFAPAAILGSALLSVPAQGGEFTEFHARNADTEADFHRPSLLPDGRSLLFVVDRLKTGADTIGVLANGVRKDVLTIERHTLDSPVYSPTGHILYHRETGTPGIWAVPFSLERLETTAAPFLVVAQGSWPAIGRNGTLVYAAGELTGLSELVWFDLQTGTVTSASNERFPTIGHPRLSPDGQRVAAIVQQPEEGPAIVVADLQRHTHIRFRERPHAGSSPEWSDARTVLYSSGSGALYTIARRAADGSGKAVDVTAGIYPSVTGGQLVYAQVGNAGGGDLWHMPLPSAAAPHPSPAPLQQLPEHESQPTLSPDGTLLAYVQGAVGESQVILRTYPAETARWQVSSDTGDQPSWSPKGDVLYYRDNAGLLFAVDVTSTPEVRLGPPRQISRPTSLLARTGFDVAPDGKRLLMVREVRTEDQAGPSLIVVLDWFAEFRK